MKEKGYIRGIYKICDKIIKEKYKFHNIHKIFVFLGQLICVKCNDELKKNVLIKLFEITYKTEIERFLEATKINEYNKKTCEQFSKFQFSKNTIMFNCIIISYYNASNVLNKMFNNVGSYNKFLKIIDENYGILSEDMITNGLKCKILINTVDDIIGKNASEHMLRKYV